MGFVSRGNPEVFALSPLPSSARPIVWMAPTSPLDETRGWAHLRSRSDADSCATSRAHTVGSREDVCLSHGTPPAVMHTSRFVNGRGLLTCKRKHLSGLCQVLLLALPSTRHKSIIRIQNAAGC